MPILPAHAADWAMWGLYAAAFVVVSASIVANLRRRWQERRARRSDPPARRD